MKILLIHPFFYPHKGGSEKYAEELLYYLKERHSDLSVDVLTYNSDHASPKEAYRGFTVYRVPCFTIIKDRFLLPNIFSLNRTLKLLSKNGYDVVYTHVRFFDPAWWGWRFARNIKATSVHTDHVASHPAYQNKLVEAVARLVDNTVAKRSLEKYDLLTAANNATAIFLRDVLKVKKEVMIVHIGVDTQSFTRATDTDRSISHSNLTLDSGKVLITYVGRMIWTKGVDLLYDAFKSLHTDFPNARLVLAGSGELEQKLADAIKKDGLENKIVLTGQLEYSEVKKLLSETNIFVNPSFHNEGLPNTILEAAASGCLIIATNNGSTGDIVIDGKTGFLIPQKDLNALTTALKKALQDPAKSRELALSAQTMVREKFDWRMIADYFYNLLMDYRPTVSSTSTKKGS